MDPEDLLRQARAALERGRSQAEVESRLAEKTNGQFESIEDLEAATGPSGPQVQPPAARQDASAAPGQTPGVREDLFEQARAALERGRTPEEVNERIADVTGGQFRTVEELNPEKSMFAGIERAPRLAADIFTLGGIDEAAGLLRGTVEGAAALVPGGRSPGEAFREGRRTELEASRERQRAAQAGAGPGTTALGVAGGIAGAVGLPRIAASAVQGARNFVRGAQGASAVPTPALPGASTIRGASTLRGGAAGTAEGGLFGFMSADPDPDAPLSENLEERARSSVIPAAGGAALGAFMGNALGLFQARSASRQKPGIGPRLADEIEEGSGGIQGKPSRIREDVRANERQISQEQFKPLEELGDIEDPNLQRTIRRGDVGEVTENLFPELAEGGRPPTFLELQKIKRRIAGLRDKAGRDGDSFLLNKWGEAHEQVTEAIGEAVEGFGPAQQAWAQEQARIRALEAGRRLQSKPLDDIERHFGQLSTDAERLAFREGMATNRAASLNDGRSMKTFLERVETSSELQGELRLILGSQEALEKFQELARREQIGRTKAQDYESIARHFRRIVGGGAGVGLLGGAADVATGGAVREFVGGLLDSS